MPVNGMLSGKGWFRDVRLRRASDALLLESLDVFSVLEFDGQRSATKFLSLSHHKLHLAQLRLSCAVVSFSKKPQLVDGSDPKGGFLIGFSLASPSGNGKQAQLHWAQPSFMLRSGREERKLWKAYSCCALGLWGGAWSPGMPWGCYLVLLVVVVFLFSQQKLNEGKLALKIFGGYMMYNFLVRLNLFQLCMSCMLLLISNVDQAYGKSRIRTPVFFLCSKEFGGRWL